MTAARFIGVDWGTSRFRAYLVDEAGALLNEVSAEDGMVKVARAGFAKVLLKHIGHWPTLPVVMAGMVGSRNGWREAPYAECPAGLAEIAAGAVSVDIAAGRTARILPGLSCRNDGVFDVMRGEETLILGAGVETGLVILPGTHSKWAVLAQGRVVSFRTFMTGEFYALLSQHSILRLLALEPQDHAGFARGLNAARRPGGLTHQAFAARSMVLDGELPAQQVMSYISGLVIGAEVAGAAPKPGDCVVVAEGQIAGNYREALNAAGLSARTITPQQCFLAGLSAVIATGAVS